MRRWMIGTVLGCAALGFILAGVVRAQQTQIPLPGGVLLQKFSQTLTPTDSAAGLSLFVATSFEQTFTVTGLATTDAVFVNGPSQALGCPMVGARVSAANTLSLRFAKHTTAGCTPVAGTYTIYSLRVNP